MPFEDLTLEQLRAATKEQLITKITERLASMTKKRICEFVWGIGNIVTDDLTLGDLVQSEDSTNGQVLKVYETTDILGDNLGSQKIEWTYYPTGEVDTITISELDALDAVISIKTIKHFKDGREPTIL